MKKLIAIVLCLTMLISAIVLSTSAATQQKSLIDLFKRYGLKPTYATNSTISAPVIDGVVNTNEYTYVRSFTNLSDSYAGKNFYNYDENFNFGLECHPNNNVTIKEYVAQDANNIYLAFEFGQDLKDFMLRFNPCQDTIYDCASSKHAQELAYDIPEGVNRDDKASTRWKEEFDIAGHQNFRLLTDKDNIATSEVEADEYDGVVQRNFQSDGETFKNITAEFRFSKAGILNATNDTTDTEVKIFSYYCKGKRTEAGANLAEGNDVTLQWTVPQSDILWYGYTSVNDYLIMHYNFASVQYSSSRAWQMFRFVCFYADPDSSASTTTATTPTTTRPVPTNSSAIQTSTSPITSSSATETSATNTQPVASSSVTETSATSTDTSSSSSATETSVIETSVTEASATNTETAAVTTTYTSQTDTMTEPSTQPPMVVKVELGCQKSLSLSALAIVPALGLGVALISKKKED